MTPDRYQSSNTGRQRLSGTLKKRGTKMGMSTWGGFLFGLPFFGFGAWAMLAGTKTIPVDPASLHAPYWVLTAFGLTFALAGLMIWGMAWKQLATSRRHLQYPNEPALADFPWDHEGFKISEWPDVAKAIGMAIGLTIFLSMFNWWAFGAGGPLFVKGMVILFDLFGLVAWWQAGRQLWSALKFGSSQIVFTQFPYRASEPVTLRWKPAKGVTQIRSGTFTLRCVEEWMETSGSGKNRSTQIVHEEIWSSTGLIEKPRHLLAKDDVTLCYELPAQARSTRLSADKPVFWELEVKLDLPGLDFKETYLVPIYSSGNYSQ